MEKEIISSFICITTPSGATDLTELNNVMSFRPGQAINEVKFGHFEKHFKKSLWHWFSSLYLPM